MAEEKKQRPNPEFDIFSLNTVYPDAASVFAFTLKPIDEVKDDCNVVVDTNALLVPFNIEKESLDSIKKIYHSLVNANRLFIPGQVAREFAKNRAIKITELIKRLNDKRNSIKPLRGGKYPLLEPLDEYVESIQIEIQIDELLQRYRKSVGKLVDRIQSWTWNDPVSMMYNKLFSESAVFDIKIDKDFLRADLENRVAHNIPPGFKDSGKQDGGIGDLLIWHTILDIGKTHGKSVLFVSNDQKSDWWHTVDKQSIYPRYELIDEFRRSSNGQSFHIIAFSQFLMLYGASVEVVEAVRQSEVIARAEPQKPSASNKSLSSGAERAILDWIGRNLAYTKLYLQDDMPSTVFADSRLKPDILIERDDGKLIAFQLFVIKIPVLFNIFESTQISQAFLRASAAIKRSEIGAFIAVVMTGKSQDLSPLMLNPLRNQVGKDPAGLAAIIGTLTGDGLFTETSRIGEV